MPLDPVDGSVDLVGLAEHRAIGRCSFDGIGPARREECDRERVLSRSEASCNVDAEPVAEIEVEERASDRASVDGRCGRAGVVLDDLEPSFAHAAGDRHPGNGRVVGDEHPLRHAPSIARGSPKAQPYGRSVFVRGARLRGEEELEQLAIHFADMYAKRYNRPPPVFTPDALAVMRAHDWPGNVRELEHWVESAIVLAPDGRIASSHLPRPRRGAGVARPASEPELSTASPSKAGVPLGLTLDEANRRYVAATVDACDGNKAEAARRLDVGRNTIGRILKGERESSPGDDEG